MKCKLEEEREMKFRKGLINTVLNKYGATETALMCGLGDHQTDLIYKYRNNPELPIPNHRWRLLCKALTKVNDHTIIREYADPSVSVALIPSNGTNGDYQDELNRIYVGLGEIVKKADSGKNQEVHEIAEKLMSELATLKKEVS